MSHSQSYDLHPVVWVFKKPPEGASSWLRLNWYIFLTGGRVEVLVEHFAILPPLGTVFMCSKIKGPPHPIPIRYQSTSVIRRDTYKSINIGVCGLLEYFADLFSNKASTASNELRMRMCLSKTFICMTSPCRCGSTLGSIKSVGTLTVFLGPFRVDQPVIFSWRVKQIAY